MVRYSPKASELWKKTNWKKLRRSLFRLQVRVWKAIRAGDKRKAKSLQKLILKSYAARMLAVRQVTQLNAGKKTAGVDGKASLTFSERLNLSLWLRNHYNNWRCQKLREIPIPKKDGISRILKVPSIADRAGECLAKFALEPDSRCNFPRQELWIQTRSAIRWVETNPLIG